jgi:hypothetical protein
MSAPCSGAVLPNTRCSGTTLDGVFQRTQGPDVAVRIRCGLHQALDRLHLPLHLPALGPDAVVDLDERLSSPATVGGGQRLAAPDEQRQHFAARSLDLCPHGAEAVAETALADEPHRGGDLFGIGPGSVVGCDAAAPGDTQLIATARIAVPRALTLLAFAEENVSRYGLLNGSLRDEGALAITGAVAAFDQHRASGGERGRHCVRSDLSLPPVECRFRRRPAPHRRDIVRTR